MPFDDDRLAELLRALPPAPEHVVSRAEQLANGFFEESPDADEPVEGEGSGAPDLHAGDDPAHAAGDESSYDDSVDGHGDDDAFHDDDVDDPA